MTRYLTKSRFKVGCECPTKLFYLSQPGTYGNTQSDDSFLKSLAEGGFQVGALAQAYFPSGILIETKDHDKAVTETNELLKREEVIIFEAALRAENLFVRVDVLKKRGTQIELIEVKAKSFDGTEPQPFMTKGRGKSAAIKIDNSWKPYLLDVAFQTYVAKCMYPAWTIEPFLMLCDKSKHSTVEGLNQLFLLTRDSQGRACVQTAPNLSPDILGAEILTSRSVAAEVELILSSPVTANTDFSAWVKFLSDVVKNGERVKPEVTPACKNCEFRISEGLRQQGRKSGFEECWVESGYIRKDDPAEPLVFDVWDFRKTAKYFEESRYLLRDLDHEDFELETPEVSAGESGLERVQRQWLQVQRFKNKTNERWIDRAGLQDVLRVWQPPYHFIDFETARPAIPFHKNSRPYEQIAFQFSHHVVSEDGTIEHRTQYLCREPGSFPNFAFIRALKAALGDQGTIFRYAAHENSVLCDIYRQLGASAEPDREELRRWITGITTPSSGIPEDERWEAGRRNMVDLCAVVKKHYYHPLMWKWNSIKVVLPAILQDSTYLIERFTKPLASLNFGHRSWIQIGNDGKPLDPYKNLPPLFSASELESLELLYGAEGLADGGAAMTAYARIQFEEMSGKERSRICEGLLRYCELDTLAMVMLFEYWRDLLGYIRHVPNRAA